MGKHIAIIQSALCAKRGADALLEAKRQDKVRFLAFTGTKTRRFISRCWHTTFPSMPDSCS